MAGSILVLCSTDLRCLLKLAPKVTTENATLYSAGWVSVQLPILTPCLTNLRFSCAMSRNTTFFEFTCPCLSMSAHAWLRGQRAKAVRAEGT